ncbi:MAG: hypothetical protein JWQ53_2851 [Klenkia sp.]|nr:hypothetical protein [Klenkia sp.]
MPLDLRPGRTARDTTTPRSGPGAPGHPTAVHHSDTAGPRAALHSPRVEHATAADTGVVPTP